MIKRTGLEAVAVGREMNANKQTNKQTDGQTNVDPSLMSKACGQTFEPPAHLCREFGCVEREKLLIIRVFYAKPSRSLDTVNDEDENIINTSIINCIQYNIYQVVIKSSSEK